MRQCKHFIGTMRLHHLGSILSDSLRLTILSASVLGPLSANAADAKIDEADGPATVPATQSDEELPARLDEVLVTAQKRSERLEDIPVAAQVVSSQGITEGREAVQGLRASTVERNDLARAITTLAEEIAAEASSHASVELHVGVEGTPRTLHPIVRDKIYRIGSEALRNAFRHAEAKQIEVELRYDERQLRLRIRDNGMRVSSLVYRSM